MHRTPVSVQQCIYSLQELKVLGLCLFMFIACMQQIFVVLQEGGVQQVCSINRTGSHNTCGEACVVKSEIVSKNGQFHSVSHTGSHDTCGEAPLINSEAVSKNASDDSSSSVSKDLHPIQIAEPTTDRDQCSELPSKQVLRRQAAAQKKALKIDNQLLQLRTEMTAAIAEQRSKLPLTDPEADRQHRVEWQHEHVPRAHLLDQAGYTSLLDKLSQWKSKAALHSQSASSRQLVADALGWECTPDLTSSVFAEKVSPTFA